MGSHRNFIQNQEFLRSCSCSGEFQIPVYIRTGLTVSDFGEVTANLYDIRVFARRKFPGSLFRNASEIWESGRRFAGKAVPKWKSPEIHGVFRRNFRCANTLFVEKIRPAEKPPVLVLLHSKMKAGTQNQAFWKRRFWFSAAFSRFFARFSCQKMSYI